jgi:hypothetical protein
MKYSCLKYNVPNAPFLTLNFTPPAKSHHSAPILTIPSCVPSSEPYF